MQAPHPRTALSTPDPVDPAAEEQCALLLTVTLLEPRWHGTRDWPPSPGRLFQALVAGAYGGRWAGEPAVEADAALSWLEALPPPHIAAPAGRLGRATLYYVPNNSLDRKGGDPAKVAEIRTAKTLIPRLFTEPPRIHYAWPFPAAETEMARRVLGLAERLHTLGRGIDAAFARGEVLPWTDALARLEGLGLPVSRPAAAVQAGTGGVEVPCPRPGTLDSLKQRHAAQRAQYRPAREGRSSILAFARPPKAELEPVLYDRHPTRILMDLRGEDGSLTAHPLTATAQLVEGVRDRLATLLTRRLPDQAALVERLLVGRGAGPSDKPLRPRLIPLPSIGMRHTDPGIRRLLLEVPADCPLPARELAFAISGLDLAMDPETGEVGDTAAPVLSPAADPGMARHYRITLSPEEKPRPQRHWITVTPALLPVARERGHAAGTARALREGEGEAVAAVRQALRHAGIDPAGAEIRVQREPWTLKGVRADAFTLPARPGGGRPATTAHLWHVALRLALPVAGPLLIGDGRFVGLGLMCPGAPVADVPPGSRDEPAEHLCFPLGPGCRPPLAERKTVVRALRRALMSRARRPDGSLPTLFSGHEEGPGPARSGAHRHLFLAAEDADGDGHIDHVHVIAPWHADRSWQPDPAERNRMLAQIQQVAAPLSWIAAGPLGVLELAPPLRPAPEQGTIWTSRTPYAPTRHPKSGTDATAHLTADLLAECRRRGLPIPTRIVLNRLDTGPAGGLRAWLTLHFATVQPGPLLLGRTAHRGGGWFRPGG